MDSNTIKEFSAIGFAIFVCFLPQIFEIKYFIRRKKFNLTKGNPSGDINASNDFTVSHYDYDDGVWKGNDIYKELGKKK